MQTEPQAFFTIREFCDRYRIKPSFFFKLQKQGKAPRTLRIGSRVLIRAQAAAEWDAAIEAESDPGIAQRRIFNGADHSAKAAS